jgi:eukaryotic-like serine/threonine-protein kinase
MGDPDSDTDGKQGEESRPTVVFKTEVFEVPVDPVLELLNQWEEYRGRGEEPPHDWTVAIDAGLREELNRRIARRRRLMALLDLSGAPSDRGDRPDEPLPSFPGHQTLSKIGRGGMGSVYKARDMELERIVAIKTIAEGRFATSDQRDRFRDEARAVARLHHPNIIAIHAVGEHDQQPYLTLEYAGGGSLADRLAEKPMAPREAAALLETLARAVQAAHQAGVVHRDLKPSNILMTDQGVPKVSDFGLAKLMDADAGRTITGQVLGSPSFMAPEQAEGRSKHVGPLADIYALGSILYQSLTGRPPFLGESQYETLKLVVSNDVVPPCRLRPDVPRDLETICLKCLAKEPSRRYADALALADDLRRHLAGRPILARRTGPIDQSWRWCRRNPGLAAASLAATVLTAVLAIGAAATAVVFHSQRDQIADDLIRIRRSQAETREERDRALAAERTANQSRSEMRAVLDFLQNKVLAAARPEDQEGGLGRGVSLRVALDTAESGIEKSFKDQPAVEGSIRAALGETYYYLGDPDQSFRQFERAYALRRQALGPEHPDTQKTADDLAHIHMDAGRLPEALALLEETWKRRNSRFGPDHPYTLTSRNNLAVAYQAAGRVADALPLYEEALRGRRAILGADHPDTLFSMNNLASAYREVGRFPEAGPLYEETLRRRRATLGSDHPDTLLSMNNLANFYRELGQFPESIALQAEALRRQEARLGPDHPDTLLSMSNLGVAYKDAGRLTEALPILQETLKRRQAKLGPDHPETLVSMSNLAGAYQAAGRIADALPLYEEALKRRQVTRGLDHPQTLRSINLLARAYLVDRPALAEPLLRPAIAVYEKKLPDDWRRFETEYLLGASLLGQKKYADAEPWLLRGMDGLKARAAKIPAASRKVLPEARDRIILLYEAWGKKEKAAEWRDRREGP